jgi:hypothetical protein
VKVDEVIGEAVAVVDVGAVAVGVGTRFPAGRCREEQAEVRAEMIDTPKIAGRIRWRVREHGLAYLVVFFFAMVACHVTLLLSPVYDARGMKADIKTALFPCNARPIG